MKFSAILLSLLLITFLCVAQHQDSLATYDSSHFVTEEFDKGDSHATADTVKVIARSFNQDVLNDLKSDSNLQYREAPTIAESLWDRFILWLSQFFNALFENAVTTNWGRVFSYAVGIVILIVLIMMILKVNAFKLFYSGQSASVMAHHVLDENIHEMDFEKLIQEAVNEADYRKAIRLLFLNSLKMLSDKNFIQWEQGKTNHDYISELTSPELKGGFNELNFYFEYAWYGNFMISQSMFQRVQHIFTDWRAKIK